MDLVVAAASRLSHLGRFSATNFDISHLNHALDASPSIVAKMTSMVVGFSSPDARANWQALKKVTAAAKESLVRFENSATEGNRFQNFTPYRFDELRLESLTLHNSVFTLLPAFPQVSALYLPMVKNGDQLLRVMDQNRPSVESKQPEESGWRNCRLRVLSAPDLAFSNRMGLRHLADICGSTLEVLNLNRASGLRADENVPVFMKMFKSLKKANVSFDVYGKSVVDGGEDGGDACEDDHEVVERREEDAMEAMSNLASGISALTTFSVLWWERMNESFVPLDLERELDEAFPFMEDFQLRFKPPVMTKGCALFTKLDESTKVLRARKNCLRAPVRASVSMETNY